MATVRSVATSAVCSRPEKDAVTVTVGMPPLKSLYDVPVDDDMVRVGSYASSTGVALASLIGSVPAASNEMVQVLERS